jgi:hypothetical protein
MAKTFSAIASFLNGFIRSLFLKKIRKLSYGKENLRRAPVRYHNQAINSLVDYCLVLIDYASFCTHHDVEFDSGIGNLSFA